MRCFCMILLCCLCLLGESVTTLYDFEAGLWGVSMSYGFGRINLNQDRKFVKSGRRSLKLLETMEALGIGK